MCNSFSFIDSLNIKLGQTKNQGWGDLLLGSHQYIAFIKYTVYNFILNISFIRNKLLNVSKCGEVQSKPNTVWTALQALQRYLTLKVFEWDSAF